MCCRGSYQSKKTKRVDGFSEPLIFAPFFDTRSIWTPTPFPICNLVTTSGIATGHSADLSKISTFRRACEDAPLAIASGITPDNALDYAADVDAFLVATGVSDPGEFHNLSRPRLEQLLSVTRQFGAKHD